MQTFLYFSLPHFVRNSIPPLTGQYYTTLKMSSLASVIDVFEIINTAQVVVNQTYKLWRSTRWSRCATRW
ncbi:hypothetical protein [Pseudomonas gingeri]|uniref:hypothetical protein n=1 Tax=Pseudomonas gingeri TaxID=117681 RepID=UPI0015A0BD67|nr:hypothetical protein [Pseudomonas gingeri]NVZ99200.1 hypothetical protein [Pseudomonas gingeri]NWA13245.1 hypothetical protein [Pseudomonas gingeri]NWA55506.1 hypothetical protein [Pseudomonas gingeri]NWA95640.1 hypothetical protein [Pseudomonas gingeri]NWB00727.1 hypothetical protein [Pseudomonas gingeri]